MAQHIEFSIPSQWLRNPANMSVGQEGRFAALRDSTLKMARAWVMKEMAIHSGAIDRAAGR